MNEDFTDIEFLRGMPAYSFIDRKAEVRISIGPAATLPKSYDALREAGGNVLLGIQSAGMDQNRLDQLCASLRTECAALGIRLAVTKSTRPFDSQWYYFGDIDGLLRAARDELARPPFGAAAHDQIAGAIARLRKM